MFKLVIFLLFVFLSTTFSQVTQLSFDNQDMNFKGCIVVNKKIICYGNYGSILTSEDNGASWQKQQVAELRDEIIKLYNKDSKLIGFAKNGKSLESDDNGKNWKVNKVNSINDILAITSDSNYIYIREFQSLKVFDYQFNQIAAITDTIIDEIFEYEDTYLVSLGDKIYFNSLPGMEIISISKSDLIQSKNSLEESKFIDSIRSVTKIGSFGDNLFIEYSMINKNNVDIREAIVFNHLSDKTTKVNNLSRLFKLYDFENNMYSLSPISTGVLSNIGIYAGLNLKKYNSDSSHFVSIGKSPFVATSLFGSFYYDGKFNDLQRYDDSTLYIVGDYKSILKSTNNGVNWQFISTKSKMLTYSLFNGSKEYHFSNKADCFRSNNSGNTFISNQYDTLIYRELANLFTVITPKKSSIHIDTNGNLVALFPTYDECLVLKSWDFGNSSTISLKSNLFVDNGSPQYSDEPMLTKLDTNYFVTQAINTGKQVYSNLYTLDTGMNVVAKKVIDGKKVDFIDYTSINNLFTIQSYVLKDGKRMVFANSSDGGDNFDNLLNVQHEYDKIYPYFLDKNKDSLLIITTRKADSVNYENLVMMFVVSSAKLDTLYKEKSPTFAKSLLNFKSKLFIVGFNFFLESNNRNNLFDWKREEANNTFWDNVTESDNDFYHVYYSSTKYPGGFYKVRLKDLTSVSEIESEKAYLYNYKPYPIPAVNSVKSLIYWNSSYNIEEAEIGIYDIFGAKLNNINYSIQKLEPFSGNLIVDCTNIPSGVYFARVALGGENLNIPIVVSK